MGQMKISEMPLAQQVNKTDYVPIVQEGANKKIAVENLMDYDAIKNKPRINGKELSSENSLEYLGIQPEGNYVTEEEFNANDFATQEDVDKKLDKNLGKENSQKILQISENGEITPVERLNSNNVVFKSPIANPLIIENSFNKTNLGMEIYGQSEQDSTTGAQLLSLDMLIIDLPYSVNGITFSDNGDGGIKVTGTATSVTTLQFNDMINNLEDGETYSYNSDTELGVLKIEYNDGTPTDYIKTVTVNKSKMIKIQPYIQYANGNTVNKVLYPILNIGDSVKPWEPYTGGKPSPSPDYPQEIISKEVSEIKLYGTNLFDLEKEKLIPNTNWNEERQCFYPEGVAYYIGILINEIWDIAHKSNNIMTISFDAKADKNGKIRIYSLGNRQTRLVSETDFFDVTQNYSRYYARFRTLDKRGELDATGQGDNCALSFYGVVGDASVIPEIKNICISVTENTEYVPFESQTITLSEPIALRGIPVSSGGNVTIDGQQYISDVICEKDGVVGVERFTYDILLDGSTPWSQYIQFNGFYIENALLNSMRNGKGFCETMIITENINDNNKSNSIRLGVRNKVIYSLNNQFYDESLADKGLTNWINYLKENHMKVVTYTETPTFEPLPEEIQTQYKALKMYYPITVINTGAPTSVTYEASLQTLFEDITNKINESVNLSNMALLYNKD